MIAVVCLVVSVQQTMLFPVLPELPEKLGVSPVAVSWLVMSTAVCGAIFTPAVARVAELWSKQRVLIVLLGFTGAGSLLGALSDHIGLLITARAIQGLGIALIPVGMALARDVVPPERLTGAPATISATLAVGAGVGLPLAGLMTSLYGWRSLFWVTGVLALIFSLLLWRTFPSSRRSFRLSAFSLRGAVLLGLGVAGTLVALSHSSTWTWPWVLGSLSAGLVLLVIWACVELRSSSPLIDVRVASSAAVLWVTVAAFLMAFGMFTYMLVATQVLRTPTSAGYGANLDVQESGLWLAPQAIALAIMTPLAVRTAARVGLEMTLVIGAVVLAAGHLAQMALGTELSAVVVGSVVVGAGASLALGAIAPLVAQAAPVENTASANGLNLLARQFGTASATALFGAVTAVSMAHGFPARGSIDALNAVAAAGALGVAVLVLVARSRRRRFTS